METVLNPMLVDFAANVAKWFPELNGRSLAVSEAAVDAENVPTLPIAMVALESEVAEHNVASNGNIRITNNFVLQFWFAPERYKSEQGESPFWAFYDYERWRQRLLRNILKYRTPVKERVRYRSMTIESDPLAVIMEFKLSTQFDYCEDDDDFEALDGLQDGQPLLNRLVVNILPANAANCPQDCLGEEKETDKCL